MLTPLPLASYRRQAWKNGLGFTDEIAIYPVGASLARGDFLWRVSSARIERSSPFSPFPYHDRVLVVLNGQGVKLSHRIEEGEPADEVDLPALEPYEFPGDVPTECTLSGGPIRDLSVFVRRGEAQAETEVLRIAPGESLEWGCSQVGFLLAVEGALRARGTDGESEVSAGDTLRVDEEQIVLIAGEKPVTAIAVRIGL